MIRGMCSLNMLSGPWSTWFCHKMARRKDLDWSAVGSEVMRSIKKKLERRKESGSGPDNLTPTMRGSGDSVVLWGHFAGMVLSLLVSSGGSYLETSGIHAKVYYSSSVYTGGGPASYAFPLLSVFSWKCTQTSSFHTHANILIPHTQAHTDR